MKNFSFFEVDAQYEKELLRALNSLSVNGISLFVEPAKEKPKTGKKMKIRNKKKR
jgi:hypothetical protein